MPDPIRTSLILPPALFDDEHGPESKAEGTCVVEVTCDDALPVGDTRPGMPLKWDPFGRDGSRRGENSKCEWSAEPLTLYLQGVVTQIDANLRSERLPTAERLDIFVSRLVVNTQRQLKHAPRKVKDTLQAMFSRRFMTFWNVSRNEKVRPMTAEELKWALVGLIEGLVSHFAVNPEKLAVQTALSPSTTLVQPTPLAAAATTASSGPSSTAEDASR